LTGEESETTLSTLKLCRLFIKRGTKEFTDGILGNVKLLEGEGGKRVVFRREPIQKLSMSVRLRPTVRCTYDTSENILRVILKEPIEVQDVPPEKWESQLVVYALKPGKAPKKDFQEFAQSVVSSS
ncbi:hypothetical protein JAAARDRAFT_85642, partial [Jaapia argillacea MUCL 33604]